MCPRGHSAESDIIVLKDDIAVLNATGIMLATVNPVMLNCSESAYYYRIVCDVAWDC